MRDSLYIFPYVDRLGMLTINFRPSTEKITTTIFNRNRVFTYNFDNLKAVKENV